MLTTLDLQQLAVEFSSLKHPTEAVSIFERDQYATNLELSNWYLLDINAIPSKSFQLDKLCLSVKQYYLG